MQNNKNQDIVNTSLSQYEELSELELETVSGGKGGDKNSSGGGGGGSGSNGWSPRGWFKGGGGGKSVAFGIRG